MQKELCEERELPPLWGEKGISWEKRREELKEILNREFCGFPPRISYRSEGSIIRVNENAFGGKGITEEWELCVKSDFSHTSFPFSLTLPKREGRIPIFLHLSFHPLSADGIGEELLDDGYGIANVYYQDMTADYYDDHLSGLGRFCTRNPYDSWGKLRMWAFGCSRILDILEKDDRIDSERAAVLGFSRLGKAALLAGAFDERYSLTVGIQSGAGGAALFRGKSGENVENLYGKGSRLWFNGNFFNYRGREKEMPFDMHFLSGLVAPRHLYVASASRDEWSDPESEFLGCVAASEAYERNGLPGLVCGDSLPSAEEAYHQGRIGYHMREGTHFLSRDDWRQVIAYRGRHGV